MAYSFYRKGSIDLKDFLRVFFEEGVTLTSFKVLDKLVWNNRDVSLPFSAEEIDQIVISLDALLETGELGRWEGDLLSVFGFLKFFFFYVDGKFSESAVQILFKNVMAALFANDGRVPAPLDDFDDFDDDFDIDFGSGGVKKGLTAAELAVLENLIEEKRIQDENVAEIVRLLRVVITEKRKHLEWSFVELLEKLVLHDYLFVTDVLNLLFEAIETGFEGAHFTRLITTVFVHLRKKELKEARALGRGGSFDVRYRDTIAKIILAAFKSKKVFRGDWPSRCLVQLIEDGLFKQEDDFLFLLPHLEELLTDRELYGLQPFEKLINLLHEKGVISQEDQLNKKVEARILVGQVANFLFYEEDYIGEWKAKGMSVDQLDQLLRVLGRKIDRYRSQSQKGITTLLEEGMITLSTVVDIILKSFSQPEGWLIMLVEKNFLKSENAPLLEKVFDRYKVPESSWYNREGGLFVFLLEKQVITINQLLDLLSVKADQRKSRNAIQSVLKEILNKQLLPKKTALIDKFKDIAGKLQFSQYTSQRLLQKLDRLRGSSED